MRSERRNLLNLVVHLHLRKSELAHDFESLSSEGRSLVHAFVI